MSRSPFVLCVGGLVVLACAACSPTSGLSAAPSTFAPTGTGTSRPSDAATDTAQLVTMRDADAPWSSALLEGGLTIDHDQCITFEGRLTVWPAGTRWDSARQVLLVGSAAPVAMGRVRLAGGELEQIDLDPLSDSGRVNVQACSARAAGLVMVSPLGVAASL